MRFFRQSQRVVKWLKDTSDTTRIVILSIAGLAAAIGPIIYIAAKLITMFNSIKVAIALMNLEMLPVILTVAALAVVIAGLIYVWNKFQKKKEDKIDILGMMKNAPPVKAIMGKGNAPPSVSTQTPLQEFQQRAQALQTGLQQAVDMGQPVVRMFESVVALNAESLHLYDAQANKLGEVALAAQQVALQTRAIIATQDVANNLYGPGKTLQGKISDASRSMATPGRINLNNAAQKISDETAMRTREMALRITDTFNPLRELAAQVGENTRQLTHEIAIRQLIVQMGPVFKSLAETLLDFQETVQHTKEAFGNALSSVKTQWQSGNIGSGVMAGLQEGVSGVIAGITPMGLAAAAVGKVMEGLAPTFDLLSAPLVQLGQIIGAIITPALKLLALPLKWLAQSVSITGEIFLRIGAALDAGIGHLLVGLGNLINKLPGSLGNPLKRAGQAMVDVAGTMYAAADQAKRLRGQLDTQATDAADGVTALADAANTAAEALSNLPSTFKYALRKFQATQAITVGDGVVQGAGGAAGAPSSVVQIVLDGKVLAQSTLTHLRAAAQGQFGSPARFTDLSAVK